MILNRQRAISVAKIVVAAALTYLILGRVDLSAFQETVGGLRYGYLSIAFGAFCAISAFEALRLQRVLRPFPVRFGHALRIHLIGSAFGNITPAQVGNDVYKIVQLGGEGHNRVEVSMRLAALRAISFLIVLLAAIAATIGTTSIMPTLTGDRWLDVGVIVGLALATLAAGRWLWRSPLRRYFPESLHAPDVVAVVGISLLMLALRVAVILLLCRSLGLTLDPFDAVLLTTMATLATALPITIAGIGVREGVIVALLTALAATYEQSVGVALLSRCFMALHGLLGALVWIRHRDAAVQPRIAASDGVSMSRLKM